MTQLWHTISFFWQYNMHILIQATPDISPLFKCLLHICCVCLLETEASSNMHNNVLGIQKEKQKRKLVYCKLHGTLVHKQNIKEHHSSHPKKSNQINKFFLKKKLNSKKIDVLKFRKLRTETILYVTATLITPGNDQNKDNKESAADRKIHIILSKI